MGQSTNRALEAARAQKAFQEMQTRWRENPNNPQSAWHFGHACFDWAEFAEAPAQRRQIAELGIEACRKAMATNPKLAPAQYYLAMNLGQLARAERLGALKLIHGIEDGFLKIEKLEPALDYAGPDRGLGLLYRDAPGWPVSVGSKRKAQEHLRKAVEIAPEYPENWLNLLESYLHWGDKKKVLAELKPAEAKLAAARQKFTGPEWQWAWEGWDQRWQKMKSKAVGEATESPRGKE